MKCTILNGEISLRFRCSNCSCSAKQLKEPVVMVIICNHTDKNVMGGGGGGGNCACNNSKALGFAWCCLPVAMQFSPKLYCNVCDYLFMKMARC